MIKIILTIGRVGIGIKIIFTINSVGIVIKIILTIGKVGIVIYIDNEGKGCWCRGIRRQNSVVSSQTVVSRQ